MDPLTDDEICQCFELLEKIDGDNATIDNGYGVTLYLSNLDVLKNNVRGRLSGASDSHINAIRQILAAYAPYRFNFTTMTAGSAGSTSGITDDPAAAKDGLRKLLQTYIPEFTEAQARAMSMRATSATGGNAVGVRGRI